MINQVKFKIKNIWVQDEIQKALTIYDNQTIVSKLIGPVTNITSIMQLYIERAVWDDGVKND
jgi:hypothetical protein